MVFELVVEMGIFDLVCVLKVFILVVGVSDCCGVMCFNFYEVDVKKKVMVCV